MKFNIIKKIKSAFFYGKAMKCFEKNNFKMAIDLFEWILQNESNNSVLEFSQYYLGRSYFAIGKINEAIDNLSVSYKAFLKRMQQMNNPNDLYHFRHLAAEYIQALNQAGQNETAEKVRKNRDQVLKWRDVGDAGAPGDSLPGLRSNKRS